MPDGPQRDHLQPRSAGAVLRRAPAHRGGCPLHVRAPEGRRQAVPPLELRRQVKAVEILDPHRIRFDLTGANDRELPLIIATMPIFPAHATDPARFKTTSLAPPIGSGPYAISRGQARRARRPEAPDGFLGGGPCRSCSGLYNFDEIRYDFYRDANTLFEAFKAGLYDIRFESDPGALGRPDTTSRRCATAASARDPAAPRRRRA